MKREVKSIIYIKLLLLVLVSSSVFLIAVLYSQPKNISLTSNVISDFDSSLLSYYPLDTNTNDLVGGNNGLNTGATQSSNGYYNRSYNFNGLSSYISVSNLNFDKNQFTVSAWILSANSSLSQGIVEFTRSTTGNGNIYRRGLLIGGLGRPNIVYSNGNARRVTDTIDIRDGQWHHLVASYNGTDPAVYIDGSQKTLDAEAVVVNGENPLQLRIGKTLSNASGTEFFNGTIDDVRIYDRALTSDEVLELYNYEILNCIDTDVNLTYSDGKNYYLLGNTNVTRNGHAWGSNTDQCVTTTTLKEFFCSSGNFSTIDYSCPSGYSCSNGACKPNSGNQTCTQTSDCGSKSNSLVCYTGSVYNQTITPSCSGGSCNSLNITRVLNKSCSYGCNPTTVTCLSQTQSQTCLDTDSGTDGFGASAFGLYDKGNVSVLNSTSSTTSYYLDSCSNSTAVLEWFCDSSGNVDNVTYNCPAGCSSEACVSNQNYPDEMCDDSDNGKNYTFSGVVDYTLDLTDSSFPDECEQNYVVEYFCSNDNYVDFVKQSCGSTKICSNGKCIPLSNNQTNGNVNISLECTDGTSSCDGTYYVYCANGQWLDTQQIPGQCGFQTNTSGNNLQGRLNNVSSNSEQGSKWLFYLLIILIILIIIGVISVIAFYIIKRKNKSQNTKSPSSKSSTSGPKSPPFPPSSGNSSQMPPVRKGFASLRLPTNVQKPVSKP